MRYRTAALFGAVLALVLGLVLWLRVREQPRLILSRTPSAIAGYPTAALPRRPAQVAPPRVAPRRESRPISAIAATDSWRANEVPRYVTTAEAVPPDLPVTDDPRPPLVTLESAALDWHPLPRASPRRPLTEPARPRALAPMYASFATLQVLDAYATWDAVNDARGREANPVLRGFADDMPQMLLAKGASTAVSIVAVEHLWKRNRTAAVATMIGINAAYAVVVAHNLSAGR